jgi:hypothetical protein
LLREGKVMGLKLVNLLRYKKDVTLINPKTGRPLEDEKGNPVTVWVRIIGDEDQQEAYKMARVKSAQMRMLLRDPVSSEYKDKILPFFDADKETCIEVIKAAVGSDLMSEAFSNVERPELPKLEEIAIDPDAATLEEQEKFDALVKKTDEEYREAVNQYVLDKIASIESDMQNEDIAVVRMRAIEETTNAISLAEFLNELADEKCWRAVYTDEKCTQPAFDSVEEFRELHSDIKRQLKIAYDDLEFKPDEIKN